MMLFQQTEELKPPAQVQASGKKKIIHAQGRTDDRLL
jgi:hypothetical protein